MNTHSAYKMARGWYSDNYRHKLARYGIKTKGLKPAEVESKYHSLVQDLREQKRTKRESFIKGVK